jgi:hypothetical protein
VSSYFAGIRAIVSCSTKRTSSVSAMNARFVQPGPENGAEDRDAVVVCDVTERLEERRRVERLLAEGDEGFDH